MSTDKPPPLRGYRETQETQKQTEAVDAKRFKEEMSKVSESDEAQKRKKRNSSKAEEEPEDDELKNKTPIAASGDLFSLFMSDNENSSMLKPQTPQNVRSTEAPTSSSHFNIEDDSSPTQQPSFAPEELPSVPSGGIVAPIPSFNNKTQSFNTQQNSSSYQEEPLITLPEGAKIPAASASTYSESNTPSDQQPPPETSAASSTSSPTRTTKKTVKDTSLLAKKAPSVAQAQKQKKEVSPAQIKLSPTKQQPAAAPPAKPAVNTEKAPIPSPKQSHETHPSTPPTQGALPTSKQPTAHSSALPPVPHPHIQESKENKPSRVPAQGQSLVQEVNKQATQTHADTSRDRSSKEKEEKKESELNAPAPSAPITPFIPAPVVDAPAYTTLSPQVYELFEKMVGLMTLEQTKGVTTTTVTVNMKNSVFDGAQIILDHYSTAPNAFNVTIAGSQQAQELVSANLASLVAAFEQSKLAFQINLRSPILLEEHRLGKRKKPPGDQEEQNKRQKN